MAQLQESRIVDAVEAIYRAAPMPALWPEALQSIAGVFDDVGAVLVYQREDGGFATIVSPGMQAAQNDYERGGWWQQDIRMLRAAERGYIVSRDAVTDRDLATDDELATLPFYAEFLAGHGLKWFAGAAISPDPKVVVVLSIQRLAAKPAYTDEELALVGQLGRHVENALRLGIRLIDAEVTSLTLQEVLSRLGVGVFLIDEAVRVVFANPAARRLIDQRVFVGGDRLTARFEPERGELLSAIAAILDAHGDEPAIVSRPLLIRDAEQRRVVAVYVLPLVFPSSHPVDHLFASARVVVVAIEAAAGEVDPSVVRDLLGLTLSEARLAALVGGGLKPREAATQLGIADATARTVLKRVFAKTGVSSQSQLAGLLSRLVLR